MPHKTLRKNYEDYMAASFGAFWVDVCSTEQKLACENFFMAGARSLLIEAGDPLTGPVNLQKMSDELVVFGDSIEARYEAARIKQNDRH